MRSLIILVILILGSCGSAPEIPKSETDPAVADALADPIMADPQLALTNQGRVAPIGIPVGATPHEPSDLPVLGDVAKRNVRSAASGGCDIKLRYAYGWMAQLPADLPLPKTVQVAEAAGSDTPTCALRIVRYQSAMPAVEIEYWRKAAVKAGYAVAREDASLRGRRARDRSAFVVILYPDKAAPWVDLITMSTR
jgi:hypothetical protein